MDDWLREARGASAPAARLDARALLALRLGLAAALAYGALAEKLLAPAVMARAADAQGLSGFLGLSGAGWAALVGVGELALAVALLAGVEARIAALALTVSAGVMGVLFRENLALHATLLAGAVTLALGGGGAFTLRVTARLELPDARSRNRAGVQGRVPVAARKDAHEAADEERAPLALVAARDVEGTTARSRVGRSSRDEDDGSGENGKHGEGASHLEITVVRSATDIE